MKLSMEHVNNVIDNKGSEDSIDRLYETNWSKAESHDVYHKIFSDEFTSINARTREVAIDFMELLSMSSMEDLYPTLTDYAKCPIFSLGDYACEINYRMATSNLPETNEEWLELYNYSKGSRRVIRAALGYMGFNNRRSRVKLIPAEKKEYEKILRCKEAVVEIAKSEMDKDPNTQMPWIYFREMDGLFTNGEVNEDFLRDRPLQSHNSSSKVDEGERQELEYTIAINSLEEVTHVKVKPAGFSAFLYAMPKEAIDARLVPIVEQLDASQDKYLSKNISYAIIRAKTEGELINIIKKSNRLDFRGFRPTIDVVRLLYLKPKELITDQLIAECNLESDVYNKEFKRGTLYANSEFINYNPFAKDFVLIDSKEKLMNIDFSMYGDKLETMFLEQFVKLDTKDREVIKLILKKFETKLVCKILIEDEDMEKFADYCLSEGVKYAGWGDKESNTRKMRITLLSGINSSCRAKKQASKVFIRQLDSLDKFTEFKYNSPISYMQLSLNKNLSLETMIKEINL